MRSRRGGAEETAQVDLARHRGAAGVVRRRADGRLRAEQLGKWESGGRGSGKWESGGRGSGGWMAVVTLRHTDGRANKVARMRAGRQAGMVAGRQAGRHGGRQAGRHGGRQAGAQARRRAGSHADECAVWHTGCGERPEQRAVGDVAAPRVRVRVRAQSHARPKWESDGLSGNGDVGAPRALGACAIPREAKWDPS
jgi:hypothetical protein